MLLTLSCGTLLSAAPIAQPQVHPNFTGTWTLAAPVPRLPIISGLGVTFSVVQTDDAITVKYLVAGGSNGLDLVRRTFSLNPKVKGSDAWPALPPVKDSSSTTTWRDASLVVQTDVTMAPTDQGGRGQSRSRPPVTETDVWSLNPDGTLTIDSTVKGISEQKRRAVFKKIAAGDLSLPIEPVPTAVAPGSDGTWLGGYRIGMTMDEARGVTACPGRKYIEGNANTLTCYFPFEGVRKSLGLVFDRGTLTSLSLQQVWGSEADARKATESLLDELQRQFGSVTSLDLPSEPVTSDAIWRSIDAQERAAGRVNAGTRRLFGEVGIVTPHRYSSAIVTASFMVQAPTVNTRSGDQQEALAGKPLPMTSYLVTLMIHAPRIGAPAGSARFRTTQITGVGARGVAAAKWRLANARPEPDLR